MGLLGDWPGYDRPRKTRNARPPAAAERDLETSSDTDSSEPAEPASDLLFGASALDLSRLRGTPEAEEKESDGAPA